MSADERHVPIRSDLDVVQARQSGRALAGEIGFDPRDRTLIATAISELARNILQYAQEGELVLGRVENNGHRGIALVARDAGPGIVDVRRALEVGFSTSGGLGLGLPGVRRLMDDFAIESEPGRGTTVRALKWRS